MTERPGWERPYGELAIGFLSGRHCYRSDSRVWMETGVAAILEVLRARCGKVVVSMSERPTSAPSLNSSINLGDFDYLPLPYIPSAAAGFLRWGEVVPVIRELERNCDAAVVQIPFSPVLALGRPTRPRVYHACADVHRIVYEGTGHLGLKRFAALGASQFAATLQRKLVHAPDARIVANGRALYELMDRPPGSVTVSATLRTREVASVRRTRPGSAPFRMLYVGYLRHEKGLDLLMRTYERVLGRLPGAELIIVGNQPLTAKAAEQELLRTVEEMQDRGRVELKGYVPFGPGLFQEYADADVLLLPSRSEGTPRVLVEARAFGCPVVATNVGGVGTSVDNEIDGLLVPPESVEALTEAVLRLAADSSLRQGLIERGYDRARQTTVEAFVDRLMGEVRILVEGQS